MIGDRDDRITSARKIEAAAFERTDATIEVVEETARIETVEHVTGTVRVRVLTEIVEETLREALATRTVIVERVPVDRMVSVVPEPRVENGVTILSIVEERLVVEKRLFLVEEVRIHRQTTSKNVEIPVTLRRQCVVVERSSDAADPTPKE